jgi:hypothetical protein
MRIKLALGFEGKARRVKNGDYDRTFERANQPFDVTDTEWKEQIASTLDFRPVINVEFRTDLPEDIDSNVVEIHNGDFRAVLEKGKSIEVTKEEFEEYLKPTGHFQISTVKAAAAPQPAAKPAPVPVPKPAVAQPTTE